MRVLALTLAAGTYLTPDARAATTGLEMVFLLDTTGSMSGEIREAKSRVKQLAEALAAARPKQRIRIGVVAYRDRGDAYVTRLSPLSTQIEDSFTFLAGLSADGGGDSPEDVIAGLLVALADMEWDPRETVERQIFLIGDAPPHLDYPDAPTPEELIARARSQRVVINAIGCRSLSSHGVEIFRRFAYGTEGSYQHIGRVRAEEPGLAAAMLRALTPTVPADQGPTEPIRAEIVDQADLLSERVGGGVHRGVLVRHGTIRGKRPGCLVTVFLGHGVGLESAPEFQIGNELLEVELSLTQGAGGHRTFELERCVEATTPIRISFGG